MTVSHNETMDKQAEGSIKDEEATEQGDPASPDATTEETKDQAAIDAPENRDAAGQAESKAVQKLKEELKAVQKEKSDINDRYMRAAAEFDNYKKRLDRQWTDFKKFANESLVKELLSVVDNLERALCSVNGGDAQTKGLCDGISMTINEILKVFENFGVTRIDSEGKLFDPNYHQAVARQPSDSAPENTILEEYQKGYLIHDRLLRPAMVVVSSGKEKPAE
ncbi:MAG: nucleotide exchange factor GrpE [Thermodesulfobacteriota bacterium]|nr:nucleotide exchange factor GrpE [Thermodesulfobacteriota bacterium]